MFFYDPSTLLKLLYRPLLPVVFLTMKLLSFLLDGDFKDKIN